MHTKGAIMSARVDYSYSTVNDLDFMSTQLQFAGGVMTPEMKGTLVMVCQVIFMVSASLFIASLVR
jgi:hypothetical protein